MLKVGDIVSLDQQPHLVLRVTESRAIVRPARPRQVSLVNHRGQLRTFLAHGRVKSISPNSELPRLNRR